MSSIIRTAKAFISIFSNKYTDSTEYVFFDFTNIIAASTHITGATVSIQVISGVDASANNVLSGSPSYIPGPGSGSYNTVVRQKIVGGVNGVKYKITCTPTTPSLTALSAFITAATP